MPDLSKFEIETLREMNGEKVPGYVGGAGMMECVKGLRARGLVDCKVVVDGISYEINEKGRAAIAAAA